GALPNVTLANNAGTLVLIAGGGIGSSSDPLETQVSLLLQATSTGGGIFVSNVGALTLTGNVVAASNIFLEATDPPVSGDNLTVNAGVTVQSTGGSVTLHAGDNVTLPATSSVQAPAGLTIVGGFGDVDGVGVVVTLSGNITAASTLVQGGPGNDRFLI